MQQCFKVAQGGGVAEYDPAEPVAIHPAVRAQHLRAEAIDYLLEDWSPRSQQLMDELVGIDVVRSQLSQDGSNGALPAADVAGQANLESQASTLPVGSPFSGRSCAIV